MKFVKTQGREMLMDPYLSRFHRGWSRTPTASNQEQRLRQSLELVKECEDTMNRYNVAYEQE
ncbi:hypothetical protein LTS10_010563 [Elasticomyces elasticus]|nr:hypothetical protein LTS10_010563 [Elasticomyces elasticus]